MLARLDEIPGVREGRVDHSGRHFLLEIDPAADKGRILAKAREALPDAHRTDPATESRLLASYRRGETWLRSSDTLELSREEARILARRQGVAAAREIGLGEAQTEKLVRIVEEETARAFERIHAAGRGLDDASREEFRDAFERMVERSRGFLAPDEVRKLEAHIAHRLDS